MLIRLLLLQPLWRKVYLRLSWSRIYVSLPRWRGRRPRFIKLGVGPSWMDPIVLFLKDDILLEEKGEANKVWRKAPRFWLFKDQKSYKRSFSRPYLLCIHPKAVEPLLEELHERIYESHTEADPCLIGPLLRDIGGPICRKKHKTTWRSVTNVRGLLQTFINQKTFLTPYLVPGLLLSGVWTL